MQISEFKVNLQIKIQDSQGYSCKQQNLAALAMWLWL
ncbi:hypothetical protein T03_6270 [Trichinella britovi]|uniref:Uncharacterized protein n=1 Tax=Trichinella britovi TaxID=45882 RepID=A0A0V0YXP1_TRIBR|nr:hypothetical protein T03_6270 [Trichinella britovi]